jgi:hypothetical protein
VPFAHIDSDVQDMPDAAAVRAASLLDAVIALCAPASDGADR